MQVWLMLALAAVLLLNLWAIIGVFRSDASVGVKALWAIGISLFPIVGLVAWLLLGPRPGRGRSLR
ncbi:PLDc N-terminal domain-containing protein [Stutzerimonas tarimensis]|uniref:PLDc N-terminal domain-containing protein n=1 Tax=Stutzerimonas tarimensis TaxID=1507735 RepID=A0ABV7TAP5_9GAMM